MNRLVVSVVGMLLLSLLSGPALAQEFALGDETKGIAVRVAENADLTVRIRLQPRLDYGDLIVSQDGASYETESDFFLRRVRLEFFGNAAKNLTYSFTLEADRVGQAGRTNQSKLKTAWLDYRFAEEFSVRFGKSKVPVSRILLTSSAYQLLVERPAATEAIKDFLNDNEQPNVQVHGNALGGALGYAVALGDGWKSGNRLYASGADNTVHKGGLLRVARIELSPPGWAEDGRRDAHLGKGRHIMLGADYAAQKGIDYAGSGNSEDRTLWGVDLSGHQGPFTIQAEYNAWKIDSDSPARGRVKPRGWYVQAGYFLQGVNIEPAARYEMFEEDSSRDATRNRITTVGVNWYLRGHGVKVGANWVHSKFDENASGRLAADDVQDVFQIQAQLYL